MTLTAKYRLQSKKDKQTYRSIFRHFIITIIIYFIKTTQINKKYIKAQNKKYEQINTRNTS